MNTNMTSGQSNVQGEIRNDGLAPCSIMSKRYKWKCSAPVNNAMHLHNAVLPKNKKHKRGNKKKFLQVIQILSASLTSQIRTGVQI